MCIQPERGRDLILCFYESPTGGASFGCKKKPRCMKAYGEHETIYHLTSVNFNIDDFIGSVTSFLVSPTCVCSSCLNISGSAFASSFSADPVIASNLSDQLTFKT